MVTLSDVVPEVTVIAYCCCAPPDAIVAFADRTLAKAVAGCVVETAANAFVAVKDWVYGVPTIVGSFVQIVGARVTLKASNETSYVELAGTAARDAASTISQTPSVGPVVM